MVKSQLDGFQSLFEGCIQDCKDGINKIKVMDPTEKQTAKYEEYYEQCASKCANRTNMSFPKLFIAIKNDLEKAKLV